VAVFGRLLSLEAIDATLSVMAYMVISLWGTFLPTTWVAISLLLLGTTTLLAHVTDNSFRACLVASQTTPRLKHGYHTNQSCYLVPIHALATTNFSPIVLLVLLVV
jgi:hypothetical protein